MSDFGNALRALRLASKKSQEEFAAILGTSKQVISRYETGQRVPKITVAREYARLLGVPLSTLTGKDEEDPSPLPHASLLPVEARKVPLLGAVAAGEPIMADPEYDVFVSVAGEGVKADAALRVEGDSMAPRYLDRDIVFIRIQDDVEDGEVAAVQIDDNVTLKHVYHIPGGVQLISDNPAYKPMTYTAENANCIRIIGKAIGYQRWEK